MDIISQNTPITLKEKGKLRRYGGIFGGAFIRTLGVLSGLTIVLILTAIVAEWGQKASCNVSIRTIYGELVTYGNVGDVTSSGELVRMLDHDNNDDSVKAVVLDVDSPGGLPVAGEEIANQLLRMKKPTVSVIRSTGASAAYWASTGAGRIFASPSSDVGSIGVTWTFPDESEKNKKEGIAVNEFASGIFKNMGTPNRPVTPAEKKLIEKNIDEIFQEFTGAVSRSRKIPLERVKIMADGSTMSGRKALEAGLVDEIGGFTEAKEYIRGLIGVPPVYCEPNVFSSLTN